MKNLRKRTKTIILLTFLTIAASIFIYKGDPGYLKQISADQAWIDFSKNLNEMVKKGDYIIYENEKDFYKFRNYKKRIAYNVELLNLKNAPKIRNVYILETKFIVEKSNIDSIVFKIKEKNTNYLIETKTIKVKNITPNSIIPVLLTLILAIIILRPILSLIVGLLSSFVIYFNGDIFLGLYKILTDYIPSFFNSSNLYLIFFIFFIHLFVLILKQINTKEITNSFKKYFSFVLLSVEPLLSVSLGNFLLNKREKDSKYKESFINHFLSMGLFSLLIFSPLLIFSLLYINSELNVLSIHISFTNLFLNLLKYRFTSISLIIISLLFFYSNRQKEEQDIETKIRKPFKPLFRSSIVFYFLTFYLISLITGILKIDYSENLKSIIEIINLETIEKILNKNYLISYLSSINLSISILATTIITLIFTLIISFKKQVINIKDVKEKTKESFNKTYKLLIIFFLSYIYTCAIKDLNSHYYIVSLFKFAITKELFFFIVFVISSLISIFLSSYISSIVILTPLIIPIASQINADNSTIITIAAILEGALIGELVSPFSNTSIVLSSIKKLNPVKHVKNQLKYITMVVLLSSIPGFLLIGVFNYFYVNYLIIILLSFVSIFSYQKREN